MGGAARCGLFVCPSCGWPIESFRNVWGEGRRGKNDDPKMLIPRPSAKLLFGFAHNILGSGHCGCLFFFLSLLCGVPSDICHMILQYTSAPSTSTSAVLVHVSNMGKIPQNCIDHQAYRYLIAYPERHLETLWSLRFFPRTFRQ